MLIKNFRNLLALLVAVIVFPTIWVLQGLGLLNMPGEILGVTVSVETMIAVFYFRKKGADDTTTTGNV